MAKTEIIGSWFNSGFHGHFRSKSRNDFYCEYRQLAKPPPPKVFNKRGKEAATTHLFSKHDNRHSFMNDALYFEEGLGRKRLRTRCSSRFNPDLLTWMPMKPETDKAGPKRSMYKTDYRGVPQAKMAEMIVRRPKTSFDEDTQSITSYRYAYGNDNPNRELLSAMSNQGLSYTNRIQKKARSRETVSSCLNWQSGQPARAKPVVPAATQLTPAPSTKPLSHTEPAAMETMSQSQNVTMTTTAPAALETTSCKPAAEMAGL